MPRHRDTPHPIGFLLLVAVFGLLGLQSAASQVLIYRAEFERNEDSVNFELYDQAYFVVSALGGTGSFVFTFREDGRDFYVRADDVGELFFVVDGDQTKAVLRATAQIDTALSHYLAFGELKSRISFSERGQKVSFLVSPVLRGHLLASDSEEGIRLVPEDRTLGFAGSAVLTASLQRKRTELANTFNLSVSEALSDLIAGLEEDGFEPESAETSVPTETEGTSIEPDALETQ